MTSQALSLAALVGEGIYNFGEVLSLPIFEALQDSSLEWMSNLLQVGGGVLTWTRTAPGPRVERRLGGRMRGASAVELGPYYTSLVRAVPCYRSLVRAVLAVRFRMLGIQRRQHRAIQCVDGGEGERTEAPCVGTQVLLLRCDLL